MRSATANGRVTLTLSGDDLMEARPGVPPTVWIEVRPAGGFASGVTAVSGQLVVWSGADVRPPSRFVPQQIAPLERAQQHAIDPNAPPLRKTAPPAAGR